MAVGPLVFQVLSLNDLDEVYALAESQLRAEIPDDTERAFRSWSVKWRKEALEHYLKLGWSFIARENGQAVGFFLGQPFIHFRGQTQTLWVEHIEAARPEVKAALIEIAARTAREKHLQRVLFADADSLTPHLSQWSAQKLSDDIAEVKTTKG